MSKILKSVTSDTMKTAEFCDEAFILNSLYVIVRPWIRFWMLHAFL